MAGKGKGFSFLGLIIGIVIMGLIGYGITILSRNISENNGNQKKAEISLNDYIKQRKDLPVGKYVSLDVQYVDGPYATNTHTETTNYFFSATSSEDNYYLVMLDDDTFMAICTSNKKEKEDLDKLAAKEAPTERDVLHLQGDLKEMTEKNDNEKDLMEYYKSFLMSGKIFPSDQRIHYLYLDTRAGRDALYYWLLGGAAALILILWIVHRAKKKKNAPVTAAPAENAQETF